jgi:hypothetical protein
MRRIDLFGILLLTHISCIRVQSVKDEYEMFIEPELKGIIDYKHLNRGGTMEIILFSNQGDYSIWIDGNYFAYELMRKGDSIYKFSNSDKILLIRGDSLIRFSSYNGDTQELRKYKVYESWEKDRLNIWESKE